MRAWLVSALRLFGRSGSAPLFLVKSKPRTPTSGEAISSGVRLSLYLSDAETTSGYPARRSRPACRHARARICWVLAAASARVRVRLDRRDRHRFSPTPDFWRIGFHRNRVHEKIAFEAGVDTGAQHEGVGLLLHVGSPSKSIWWTNWILSYSCKGRQRGMAQITGRDGGSAPARAERQSSPTSTSSALRTPSSVVGRTNSVLPVVRFSCHQALVVPRHEGAPCRRHDIRVKSSLGGGGGGGTAVQHAGLEEALHASSWGRGGAAMVAGLETISEAEKRRGMPSLVRQRRGRESLALATIEGEGRFGVPRLYIPDPPAARMANLRRQRQEQPRALVQDLGEAEPAAAGRCLPEGCDANTTIIRSFPREQTKPSLGKTLDLVATTTPTTWYATSKDATVALAKPPNITAHSYCQDMTDHVTTKQPKGGPDNIEQHRNKDERERHQAEAAAMECRRSERRTRPRGHGSMSDSKPRANDPLQQQNTMRGVLPSQDPPCCRIPRSRDPENRGGRCRQHSFLGDAEAYRCCGLKVLSRMSLPQPADKEGAVSVDGHAAEAARAGAVPRGHGGDSVPGDESTPRASSSCEHEAPVGRRRSGPTAAMVAASCGNEAPAPPLGEEEPSPLPEGRPHGFTSGPTLPQGVRERHRQAITSPRLAGCGNFPGRSTVATPANTMAHPGRLSPMGHDSPAQRINSRHETQAPLRAHQRPKLSPETPTGDSGRKAAIGGASASVREDIGLATGAAAALPSLLPRGLPAAGSSRGEAREGAEDLGRRPLLRRCCRGVRKGEIRKAPPLYNYNPSLSTATSTGGVVSTALAAPRRRACRVDLAGKQSAIRIHDHFHQSTQGIDAAAHLSVGLFGTLLHATAGKTKIRDMDDRMYIRSGGRSSFLSRYAVLGQRAKKDSGRSAASSIHDYRVQGDQLDRSPPIHQSPCRKIGAVLSTSGADSLARTCDANTWTCINMGFDESPTVATCTRMRIPSRPPTRRVRAIVPGLGWGNLAVSVGRGSVTPPNDSAGFGARGHATPVHLQHELANTLERVVIATYNSAELVLVPLPSTRQRATATSLSDPWWPGASSCAGSSPSHGLTGAQQVNTPGWRAAAVLASKPLPQAGERRAVRSDKEDTTRGVAPCLLSRLLGPLPSQNRISPPHPLVTAPLFTRHRLPSAAARRTRTTRGGVTSGGSSRSNDSSNMATCPTGRRRC
ncbi:hypothetical protein HU200_031788 [Digitaria exilis]|uniref:Uncharacterized protein n=1 Tax=Digitaria exilis TaxID=1010633 RepID=A0A835EM10_9POAL|nr:hypothetical protein HU200_031788 [Digitaria exilis]